MYFIIAIGRNHKRAIAFITSYIILHMLPLLKNND